MMLNRRDDIGIWRSIPVARLCALLQSLPGDHNVVVSRVGELLIMHGKKGDEDNWHPIGVIELAEEKYSPWEG